MNWLTQKEIKERSKTVEGALDVSIEHHEQIHEAGREEYLKAQKQELVGVDGDYCGLCQHFKDNCSSCFLYNGKNAFGGCKCCNEWLSLNFSTEAEFEATTQALLNRLYLERGKLIGKTKPCKPEPKKEIRHGEYKVSRAGAIQLFVKEDDGTMRLCQKEGLYKGSTEQWIIIEDCNLIHSGNVFDDLEALKEDLTEFAIKDVETTVGLYKVKARWVGGKIEFDNYCNIHPTLDQAKELAHKLLQMVATAQRQKDC